MRRCSIDSRCFCALLRRRVRRSHDASSFQRRRHASIQGVISRMASEARFLGNRRCSAGYQRAYSVLSETCSECVRDTYMSYSSLLDFKDFKLIFGNREGGGILERVQTTRRSDRLAGVGVGIGHWHCQNRSWQSILCPLRITPFQLAQDTTSRGAGDHSPVMHARTMIRGKADATLVSTQAPFFPHQTKI